MGRELGGGLREGVQGVGDQEFRTAWQGEGESDVCV